MEIHIDYPPAEQEEEIVLRTTGGVLQLPKAAFERSAFLELRDLVWAVPVPASLASYVVRLCGASRPGDPRADAYVNDYVAWGAGPRGSQYLVLAGKARALLDGRTAPTAADVQAVALPILRHRLILNHRAVGDRITTPDVVRHLLDRVSP
jgi:MoxR-like ATPase